jgi:hypothetical protein
MQVGNALKVFACRWIPQLIGTPLGTLAIRDYEFYLGLRSLANTI